MGTYHLVKLARYYLVIVLIFSCNVVLADTKLDGIFSKKGDGFIFKPCFCVHSKGCPCFIEPTANDVIYYIPQTALADEPEEDPNSPHKGGGTLVLKDDATIYAEIRVPLPAKALREIKENSSKEPLSSKINDFDISLGINTQFLYRALPEACLGNPKNCRCRIDGYVTTCAFVNSCLDAGFCYVLKP